MDEYVVSASRIFRIIGILVALQGIVLFLMGTGLQEAGALGRARYEKATGKLIRFVSDTDQKYYGAMKNALVIGVLVRIAGVLVWLCGMIVIMRPGLLTPVMRFLGVELGPAPPSRWQVKG